ncbi:hypothetical protein BDU57DRAFT_542624 [Ampelomyces quisqualis]|uniref:Uncharacterized protein n=1 Tax=Ampelomyces quisqualis TaxID=50730 RepID=A0A6A5QB17_AMPQU|nr:hypothetical protein BDU57DRAFT_542624 [Ampelomyces quisqualis]
MSTPQPSDLIPLILSIWSTTTLLPPSIPPPPTFTPALLSALHSLALLTPAQPHRAWNLLSTYFHMRVRERRYTPETSTLDEADISKAVHSVQRMSVGMALEDSARRKSSSSSSSTIHDHMHMHTHSPEDDDDDAFPPLPPGLDIPTPATPPPIRVPCIDALREEMRAATQETNLRRREMEMMEEEVRGARARYEVAKGVAERLRSEVRRRGGMRVNT